VAASLESELDLARHASKPVRKILTTDVLTVEPDASLDDVLEILASDDRNVNRVPVVEGESLVGLVTRQDLLRALHAERSGE